MRFRLLRTLSASIIAGCLSFAVTYTLYWILKGVFNFDISDSLSGLIVYLFFSFMVLWLVRSTETTQEKGTRKLHEWFDSKLQGYDLRTRYLLRKSLFRIGIILILGTILYSFFATYAGESHTFAIDLFVLGIFLVLFSPYFLSDKDVALVSFRKFRNAKIGMIEDLNRALYRYNKSVGFRFSSKRLSAMVQYIEQVDNLDLEEEKSQIDTRLDSIIQLLQGKKYGEIPEILANLSTDSDLFIQKFSDLGLEIKSSLRTRIKENCTSALQKVLPQLFWLLILLIVYQVLVVLFPTIRLPFP